MDYVVLLFIYAMLEYGQGPHAYTPCMANTISREIRLHIMNEQWVHTYTHTGVLQGKLVLINLARGTRHVFPFTSWHVPREAQWKPSILVCLQFVCLNFLLICIFHWWPVGLVQEVLSEYYYGISYSDIIHHAFLYKKSITQLDPFPLPCAFTKEYVLYF